MSEPVVTSEKLMALGQFSASLSVRRLALEEADGDVELAAAILTRQGFSASSGALQHAEPVRLGDEEPNDDVRRWYEGIVLQQRSSGDPIDQYLAFDFRQKIMALTNEQVMVIAKDGVEAAFAYAHIIDVPEPEHDREIVLGLGYHQYTYRVGDAGLAQYVRHTVRSRIGRYNSSDNVAGSGQRFASHDAGARPENGNGSDDNPGIADRVRFWEEQDRINRELIPRVIRQHELLTQHVGEHENLPELASRTISVSLAAARDEQQRQFESALDAAKAEIVQQSDARLQQALADLQSTLDIAKVELSEQTATALSQALADLQSALTAHKTELEEQTQAGLDRALAAIQQQGRKSRNLLIGIAAGSAAISIALIVVNIVTG